MQERIGNWIWTSALLLAACGGVEAPGSLAKSREALAPTSAASTASATFTTPPPGGRTCHSDADCAAGEECESEHGQYYCAPRHEDKDYYGADAGAPREECRHQGEDCYASAAPDAGAYVDECDDDEHHGDEYSDGDGHEDREGYEDRSGSNRGPH